MGWLQKLRPGRPQRAAPVAEAMEPRLLYSADAAGGLMLATGAASPEVRYLDADGEYLGLQPPPAVDPAALSMRDDRGSELRAVTELVFVDLSVPDAGALLADLRAQQASGRALEIVTIREDDDGLAVIGDTLAGRKGIAAVHVLSHGSEASVQIGGSRLDAATLEARRGEIAGWGAALTRDADLLFYGCEVAGSPAGLALMQRLGAITGTEVAGSTDLTGAARLGGDWTLEASTGAVEAGSAIGLAAQGAWQGVLATFTVTSTADTTVLGSLRWAIEQANLSLGADTIVLPAGTYRITLPGDDDANLLGDFDISSDVTITGAGSGTTIVDGNGLDRVFDIRQGNVTVTDLTVTGGAGTSKGGGFTVSPAGAGALSLTLERVVVTGNEASSGGGIFNAGTLLLRDVHLQGNTASGSSGAGGGLENNATATLVRVTVSGNTADQGGGIYTKDGTLTLDNSTVSGNTATGEGGGIYANDPGNAIANSTIAFNSAPTGGGLYSTSAGLFTIRNTILADNTGGSSNTTQVSQGYNLDTDSSNAAGLAEATDLHPASAGISALADNGGATPTHALLAGSAAIDAGDPAAPAADQRGTIRVGSADIGAFEAPGTPPTVTAIADQSTQEDTATAPIAFTVGDAETDPASLVVTATSSDTAILAPGGILLGGSGANRTLTLTPVSNARGPVTVTVMVSDGVNSTSTTFDLTVVAVNDPPTTSTVALGTVAEDSGPLTITSLQLLGNAGDVDGDTLTAGNLSLASGSGTLVDNGDGTWSFTATPNFNGPVSFTYDVGDGTTTTGGTATLSVAAVNDAPTTSEVQFSDVMEDSGAVIITSAQLLANATDVDGDTLTVSNVISSSGTTITDNGDGTWTLTRGVNFNGVVSLTYDIGDGTTTIAGTARMRVTPVDDAPTTSHVTLPAVAEDPGAITITSDQLLANAVDPDGDPLRVQNLAASSGTLVNNGDGTWTYTPAANFNGTVDFTYRVRGQGPGFAAGTASMVITPVEDVPTTTLVTLPPMTEDTGPVTITTGQLLANAQDGDSDPLAVANVTASGGTLVDNGDGTWTFTPAADFNGTITVAYDITDGKATVAGSAQLVVLPANDAPTTGVVTLPDMAEDGSIILTTTQLTAAAVDIDGDALSVSAVSASSGTLVDNGDGTWTFTPASNFNGAVTFSYTISDGTASIAGSANLTVTPVNDAPTTSNVTLPGMLEDGGPVLITTAQLVANAADIDGGALTVGAVSASSGVLVDNGDGTWTFTPAADFNGTVVFSYTISDGSAFIAAGATMTVTAVNDDFTDDSESRTVAEDSGTSMGNLLAGTSSVDGPVSLVRFQVGGTTYLAGQTATVAGGTITILANGNYSFTPAADWNGAFPAVTYTVTDGSGRNDTSTLALTVSPENDGFSDDNETRTVAEDSGGSTGNVLTGTSSVDGPVSVGAFQVAGDASVYTAGQTANVAGGTLTIAANGSYTFTPAANFSGTVPTVTYIVTDGSGTDVRSTLALTVAPVNDPPDGAGDSLATREDTPVTWTPADLLGNDTDVDGDTLAIASVSSGSGGTAVLNADGSVTFRPAADFNGVATFTYTVTDGTATSGPVTVRVNVAAVNDAPVAADDVLAGVEDQPVTWFAADLLGNDGDVERSPLAVATVANGTGGTAVLQADGSIRFVPDADFHGDATFTYTVTDGSLGSRAATVTVRIAPVNDAPVVTGGAVVAVPEGQLPVADVLASDPDGAGERLRFAIAGGADAGRFVIDAATGQLRFAAETSYDAPGDADRDNVYTVLVQVSDGTLSTTQAFTVQVQDVVDVAPPPPPPPPPPAPPPPPPTETPPQSPPPPPPPPTAPPATPPATAPATPQDGGGPGTLPPMDDRSAPALAVPMVVPLAVPTGEPSQVLRAVVFDREGIELVSLQGGDLSVSGLGTAFQIDAARMEDLQRSLRSGSFAENLNQLRNEVQENLALEQSLTVSVAGVSLGLSLAYVLWLIRGGVLMGSYLSALPAWRILDPLPVLARPDEEEAEDDDLGEQRRDAGQSVLRGF